jgi:hypothetical protein
MCRCRTAGTKDADAGLTFSGIPAFACYCIPFRRPQYKRAECIHFDCQQYSIYEGVSMYCTGNLFTLEKFLFVPDCPASSPAGTRMNKNTYCMPMPEPVRYRNALVPD